MTWMVNLSILKCESQHSSGHRNKQNIRTNYNVFMKKNEPGQRSGCELATHEENLQVKHTHHLQISIGNIMGEQIADFS